MYTTLIRANELAAILEDENTRIIDCRFGLADTNYGRDAYATAHIPKAIYAHLDDDLSGEIIPSKTGRHPLPTIEQASERFSIWGIDSDTQVVVYDDKAGAIAARLWWMLQWLGHEKVAVLDGGWQAWEGQELPLSMKATKPSPRTFIAHPKADSQVDISFVKKIVNNKNYVLVDSRTTERYLGKNEPIDPIAGHIPSAISAPFVENIGANKQMLNKEALQVRFQEIMGDTALENIVFYCGSGVTACYNLLALQHAGLGKAKLYAGSWSEWITRME